MANEYTANWICQEGEEDVTDQNQSCLSGKQRIKKNSMMQVKCGDVGFPILREKV